jgi:glycosyl transferase family 25
MKAKIISLSNIPSSKASSERVFSDLKRYGIDCELFEGTYGDEAEEIFSRENRKLAEKSFKGFPVDDDYVMKSTRLGVKGCFLSHYGLWKECADNDEPIMIFEDDVLFYRGYIPVEFDEVLMLATGKNLHEKPEWTKLLENPEGDPSALPLHRASMPGAVGYAIKPEAAKKLVERYKTEFLPADNALNVSVVKLQYHNYLMGRAATGSDGKKSLTKSGIWEKRKLKTSSNSPSS